MKRCAVGILASIVLVFALVLPALAYENGGRVIILWEDGFWYPATIQQTEGTVYTVLFDDGTRATADEARMKAIDWKKGDALECNWQNRGTFYAAKVTSREGESLGLVYDADGAKEDAQLKQCRQKRK